MPSYTFVMFVILKHMADEKANVMNSLATRLDTAKARVAGKRAELAVDIAARQQDLDKAQQELNEAREAEQPLLEEDRLEAEIRAKLATLNTLDPLVNHDQFTYTQTEAENLIRQYESAA
jgi:hypothetical protein